MEKTVTNPPIPYSGPIQGGFSPGKMVRVQGYVPPNSDRFDINLLCGPSKDESDIALHVSVRLSQGYIARNSCQFGNWGDEQDSGSLRIAPGENFEIIILNDQGQYKIAVNGQHFCEFRHRISSERVTHIAIEGTVSISLISFEGSGGDHNDFTSARAPQSQYAGPPGGVPAYGPPPSAPYAGPPGQYGPPGYGPPPYGSPAGPYGPGAPPPAPGAQRMPMPAPYPSTHPSTMPLPSHMPSPGIPIGINQPNHPPPYPSSNPFPSSPCVPPPYPHSNPSYPNPAPNTSYPSSCPGSYPRSPCPGSTYPYGSVPPPPPGHKPSNNPLKNLGNFMGPAAAAGAMYVGGKKLKKSKLKKAMKYGLPIAGAGLGTYALAKAFKHSSSSSSSSSSDSD